MSGFTLFENQCIDTETLLRSSVLDQPFSFHIKCSFLIYVIFKPKQCFVTTVSRVRTKSGTNLVRVKYRKTTFGHLLCLKFITTQAELLNGERNVDARTQDLNRGSRNNWGKILQSKVSPYMKALYSIYLYQP